MKEPIHINIKALRKVSKLTQNEAADRFGVPRGTYSKWEEGLAKPSLTIIDKICDLYNVTFKQLIGSEALPDGVAFETRYSTAPDNVKKAIDLLLN